MKKLLLFVAAFLFVTANTYADYCAGTAPNSSGGGYYGLDQITAKVNGVEAFSWSGSGTLEDASSTCSMEIKAGDVITFVVSSASVHSSWGQTVVYFDWNQNQDWTDSGESTILYTNPLTQQSGNEYTITVPSDFSWNAGVSSMKIRINSGEAPQHNTYGEATPCQALSRGRLITFSATPPTAVVERTIKFTVSPAGAGTLSNYEETSANTISSVATANDGFVFVNWTLNGEEVTTSTSIDDRTEGNKTYVANFANDPRLDRSNWTITASSEETTGEGAGNGVATCIIDGNPATFWHSQWSGSEPAYPHWFMIDMKESKTFDQFEYVSRGAGTGTEGENNGNIKNYQLYVSETALDASNLSNDNLVSSGTFTYDGTTTSHVVTLPVAAKGRYVMLYATGQSANGRVNASCIEFYLYSSSYTVTVSSSDVAMGTAYIGTEGTISTSCSTDGTDVVTLTAVPATGYQFANWTLDGVVVSTEAEYTTTAVTESRNYVANFEFKPVEPRTVKVASNDKTKGYAVFVSPMPEGTATDVTTGEIVTVKAIAQTSNDVFVNWTINGEVVSTEETYAYAGAEAVTIQANFATLYPITITQTSGGIITVKQGAETISNGDRVAEGSTITITAKGSGGQWVKSLIINGENVMNAKQQESVTTQVTVNGATTITATYGTPAIVLTYEYSGNGYIEVWSSDSYNEGDEETFPVTPAGDQYAMWDEVGDGGICIFAFPGAGAVLESLTIDGEEQDLEGDLAEYGDIFWEPTAPVHIEAVFTGQSTGVATAEATETSIYAVAGGVQVEVSEATAVEVYSIAGTIVAEKVISGTTTIALEKGVYIVKAANEVVKVVVK
ncbi:MAG: discoidin domain-containing protein [Bacteroidales bacterium]|nr:discoidin domain-containing protein [Bacteroidales bacterium]